MSKTIKLGDNPYERLAWAVITDALRAIRKGDGTALWWLQTEGEIWLDSMGINGEEFVNKVVHILRSTNDGDHINILEMEEPSWQMRLLNVGF